MTALDKQISRCRIHLVAGTRPNIVKIAPLYSCLKGQGWCNAKFIWFTQHYTPELADDILADFGIEAADHVVAVEQSTYGARLGSMINGFIDLCERDRPDIVVVAGDVDTTLGAALAAKRMGIPVVHLEAGLRSYDASMPEEINRVLIDSISDIWLAPSEAASQNLVLHEGRPPGRVHFVGNIMIDSLRDTLSDDVQATMLDRFGMNRHAFGVATFHRPGNVDNSAKLAWLIDVLEDTASLYPLVVPLHPRTRAMLEAHGMLERIENITGVVLAGPIRYRNFINLLAASRFVLTDSGGLQEEAATLGKFCFTLRDNTERPITQHCGSNHLVNEDTAKTVIKSVLAAAKGTGISTRIPLWDGLTAERCSHVLKNWWIEVSRCG
ncbi:UDP-N-acetylglucosamine 2-epimerase (non-hydrolyzing) [Rhodobacteraceae bacterium MBR-64]